MADADVSTKQTRRAFSREFKLSVVQWFHSNNKNVLQTSNHFKIDRKQLRTWIKAEKKIRKQKSKSMNERGRKAYFPRMEEKLVQQFKEQRKKGKTVKKWWFLSIARKIMNEEYSKNIVFKYSNRWFNGFCRRNRISLRRKTHTAQKSPATLKEAIQKFHAKLLRERIRGTFQLGDIANMDQTPLPFVLNDGRTYDTTGAEEVWCSSGASDLDKWQCRVQLTVFGDGITS